MSERAERAEPQRKRLPDTRYGMTRHFTAYVHIEEKLVQCDGYIRTGCYPDDGSLGEFFVTFGQQGHTVGALIDSVAVCCSQMLQCGIPIERIAPKHIGSRFEPAGPTGDPLIPRCTSVLDYIFRFLLRKYGNPSSPEWQTYCSDAV